MAQQPLFATCLNCMDGRVQEPVIQWIKAHTGVTYVDMITEAGMDGLIAKSGLSESLKKKIQISTGLHGSAQIFIAGHDDCGGHPVTETQHRKDISTAISKLKQTYPDIQVRGLWVDKNHHVEGLS